ncbi:MAG: MazG nucleotide pyrophosphohydrolase domain-containing protein [Limisphaerales bacterium]
MKKQSAINDLLKVMAKLRSPKGCPWDREQTHLTLRRHAIEEVYELIDAIEARDDHEMAEGVGRFVAASGFSRTNGEGARRI